MRRFTLALVLAGVATFGVATPASGHAMLVAADPASGAVVQTAPAEIRLTFSEAPDPGLVSVSVLDTAGRARESGPPEVVAGSPEILRLPVEPLDEGVYTVTWRVVSRVDGHLTAGSFAFGLNVDPDEVIVDPDAEQAVQASRLGIAGRWGLYAGLGLLVGTAWMSIVAFRAPPAAVLRVMVVGLVLAVAGLALLVVAQRADAQATLATLLGTAVGRGWMWRAAGVAAAGVGVGLVMSRSEQVRGGGLVLAGAGGAAAMLAHASFSHAGASPTPVPAVGVHWIHMLAVGAWLGGLVALLVGMRSVPEPESAVAAKRFSVFATVALAVVAATGVARAVAEVGAFSDLLDDPFGRLVVAKTVGIVGLAGLGAVNRFRAVPSGERGLGLLRRVGVAEIAVAAVVLVMAGALAQTPPSAYASRDVADEPVVASGSDFAQTIRVRLQADPGLPGPNRFRVELTDFDTGARLQADGIQLRFSYPLRPDVAESTMELPEAETGVFEAQGANMALAGRWRVTALVRRGVDSVEIPLEITTRAQPGVQVVEAPGQPTIHMVDLGQGRLAQLYLDPGSAGHNEVHITYFDAGVELRVGDAEMIALPPDGDPRRLEVMRFSDGHFIGQGDLSAGSWRILIFASDEQGRDVNVHIAMDVEG